MFNNNHLTHGPPRFLPTWSSSRRGLHPPLRGGNSSYKEWPVLPTPSYPALCREDTTSWNDGRSRKNRAVPSPTQTHTSKIECEVMLPNRYPNLIFYELFKIILKLIKIKLIKIIPIFKDNLKLFKDNLVLFKFWAPNM